MTCPNCGNEVPEGFVKCAACGVFVFGVDPNENVSKDVNWKTVLFGPYIKSRAPYNSDTNSNESRFNFEAFFFGWIWAFANGQWLWGIVLLAFSISYKILPFVFGIVFLEEATILLFSIGYLAIYFLFLLHFGSIGNALVWKSRKSKSISQFGYLLAVYICVFYITMHLIPNVLITRDNFYFRQGVKALTILKEGEEKYKRENHAYTSVVNDLGKYLIPECRDNNECNVQIEDWMKQFPNYGKCYNIDIVVFDNGQDYQIKCNAPDRNNCKMCANTKGVFPVTHSGCKQTTSDYICP